jgi:hypothetical protein
VAYTRWSIIVRTLEGMAAQSIDRLWPGGLGQNAGMSRRRIVVLIAVVVVVAAGVWWRQTITADPKLHFTMFNRVDWADQDGTGAAEGITRKDKEGGTQVDVAFVSGRRVFVYLGLRNGGSRGVRIDQVPATGFYYFGFDTMEVSPDVGAGTGAATSYEAFKPFILAAGEARNVRLVFRMADCGPTPTDRPAGTTSIHGLVVRYKILGVGRASLVPFDESALGVATIGHCEHPISEPTGS